MRTIKNLLVTLIMVLYISAIPTSNVNAGFIDNELGLYCIDEANNAIVISQWIYDTNGQWRFAMPDGTIAKDVTLQIGEAQYYFDMTTNSYVPFVIAAGAYYFDVNGVSGASSNTTTTDTYTEESDNSTAQLTMLTEAELAAIAGQYVPAGVGATYSYSLNMGLGYYVYFDTIYGKFEVILVRDMFSMVLYGNTDMMNQYVCQSAQYV